MPSAAAIYLRISKDALDLGLGVDRQRDLCVKLAERMGWTVAEVYQDNDLSASSSKPRPDYLRMCDDIVAGMRDGIVCVDQDRLVRKPRELEDVIELGVPIALDSGEYDLTQPDDRMTARMRGTFSAGESERLSQRIRRQKQQARANGWWVGQPPFGYRTVAGEAGGRRLVKVDDEAAVVVELARQVLDEGATWGAAARWASQQTGKVWSTVQVKRVLTRPATAGWQPVNRTELFRHPDTGQPVRVTDDPVLDEVTWQRLLRLTSGRKPTGVSGRSSQVLLARLVWCAVCGHQMSWSAGGSTGRPRYVCRTSYERVGCPGNTAAAGRVDRLVEAWMVDRLATIRLDGVGGQVDDAAAAEVARLADVLAREESQRRQLVLDGASPERLAQVSGTVDAVDRQLRDARTRLERSRRQVDVGRLAQLVGDDLPDGFAAAEVEVRRQVVRLLVDRVEIAPAGGRTSVFDPARVTVVGAG